ncbi:hypothetical protein C5167_013379 [Papaver somniferum]|uniref:Alliinase C-terminal domain-containing protein n=1 Tax=Papaver somniferum TaxID=3469 RepID=A0A4Y7J374_PAPSO|nr:hypothetical protein C5167_013379 [Papaver somniferum]
MALNISFLLSRLLDESESLRFKIHEDEKSQERGDNASPAALAEEIIEVKKAIQPDSFIIDLGHGDPTMYEQFWKKTGKKATILIPGWQSLSYYSDINNVCWFLEPKFAGEVRRPHKLVGNANTDNRHIVVGTGSSQLYMAALYALALTDSSKQPITVVSTGHAGTRIGWALVKDKDIAQKMTEFIELNTIGVSKDSQLRAAKILGAVSDSCTNSANSESFFEFGHRLMTQRWKQLRDAVRTSGLFSLPECEEDIEDCERFLGQHKIITRSGKPFRGDINFDKYGLFVERLSNIITF